MRRPVAVLLFAAAGVAEAAEPPLGLRCEALGERRCAEVEAELRARFGSTRRVVRGSTVLPRAKVSPRGESAATVEVRVRWRPPTTRDLDLAGEPSEPWAIALAIEQMLEAAIERPASPPAAGPRDEPAALWVGLEGGARGDASGAGFGPALQGGVLAGWSPGALLVTTRAYGESFRLGPWATVAFGLSAGPGVWLLRRPSIGVALLGEAFARLVSGQHRDAPEDVGQGIEVGGGLRVEAEIGRWQLRPVLSAAIEAFRRQNPCLRPCGTDDPRLDPPVLAPALRLGVVYHL